MRFQRAVAAALLSLSAGCGQAAIRHAGGGGADVVWGVHDPGDLPLADPEGIGVAEEADELEATPAEAFLAGSESLWPAASHPKVVLRADRLCREAGGLLESGLARSGRYLDIIARELRREGLPMELAYLPIIESNFSHKAVGSGGVGLWQFTAGTAKRYGLIVNREVDERRDPEKASRAAARLLRDLYDQFESWDLAIAAYNAGAGRVGSALARNPGASFWQLADRAQLPRVTREYVPKVLATALIASRPERYGFDQVDRHEPLRYDTFVVSQRLEVATIASLCGRSTNEIAELNPSLKAGVVPRVPSGYQIRLPRGTCDRFAVAYAAWQGRSKGA